MTARSNVTIYGIDPRGLATTGDEAITAVNALPALGSELRRAQDSLRQISEDSGGFASVNRNDTAGVFDRIVRDNSSYYVLAYYPPSTKTDGKFHRIEVRVNRPGLTVRARRGYSAPNGKQKTKANTRGMPQELYDAINSPLPVGGLTMYLFAAPFKGPEPNASVVVSLELNGADLSIGPGSKVDISFMAVDSASKVFGARNQSLTLNLSAENRARVQASGVRVVNRIDLPPGRYQLHAAARDSQKKLVGSVIYDLEVPDFYRTPMSLSGITLTSTSGSAMMTALLDAQVTAALPAPPSAQRAFPQNEELTLFEEVYDNSGASPHKVDLVTSVATDQGRPVYKAEDVRDSSELQNASGSFGYATRLPLSELPPGDYVLTVEARSRLGNNISATRQVPFRVVPQDANPGGPR